MPFEFRKSTKSAAYFVNEDGKALGAVRKEEGWTVRGRPIKWVAFRLGKPIGSAPSREAAARLLLRA